VIVDGRLKVFGSLLLRLKFFWEAGEMIGDIGCLGGVGMGVGDFRSL